jgi:mitotic spindle assembly checkpoint protein MAD2B
VILLLKGNLDKVVIVIKDKSEIALERFIFSLRSMITVEPENRDAPYVTSSHFV